MYAFKDPVRRASSTAEQRSVDTLHRASLGRSTAAEVALNGGKNPASTPAPAVASTAPAQLHSRSDTQSSSVAADMANWKANMQAERQRRLVASQRREESHSSRRAPPVRAAPRPEGFETAAHHNESSRLGRAGPNTLSFSEYRNAILATHRSSAEVVATARSSRSASQNSIVNNQRQNRQHGSPIAIPNKWIDPMDVEYRPARSVVRQYREQEPSPYFPRKNPYGAVDHYSDRVSTSYQRQSAPSNERSSSHPQPAQRSGPHGRDTKTSAIRPYKEPRAVWREPASPTMYDYPTPRSTTLRNQYIAQRQRRAEISNEEATFGMPRSSSRLRTGSAGPKPYIRSQSIEVEKTAPHHESRDARLVGAPSPRVSVPSSVAERLVSPHHNGARELKSRRGVEASNEINDDDENNEDVLDPVPLSFAPSPRQHVSTYSDDSRFHRSPTSMARSPVNHNADRYFHQANTEASPSSALRARRNNGIAAGPYVPGHTDNHESSPGVDVSPPTPCRPSEHQLRDSDADVSNDTPLHRHSSALSSSPDQVGSHRGNIDTSAPRGGGFGHTWSVPQPMLPTMRTQREDLFQGHMAPSHNQRGGSAAQGTTNLRQSSLHDRLEHELLERSQAKSPNRRFLVSSGRTDATEDLSTSRTLLRHLATKRVPQ